MMPPATAWDCHCNGTDGLRLSFAHAGKRSRLALEATLAMTYPNPQALLSRYPAVDASERKALVAWVRTLRVGPLVALLADRKSERKLLELRVREPELEADGRQMLHTVMALALAGGAAVAMTIYRLLA
jgi:hypothetical protein